MDPLIDDNLLSGGTSGTTWLMLETWMARSELYWVQDYLLVG
jgi:hypothetical protein